MVYKNHTRSRPPGPRLARQSHCRSRRSTRVRRVRPRIVPSGASTGEHEALELRDGDKSKYWQRKRRRGCSQRQFRNRQGRNLARMPPTSALSITK